MSEVSRTEYPKERQNDAERNVGHIISRMREEIIETAAKQAMLHNINVFIEIVGDSYTHLELYNVVYDAVRLGLMDLKVQREIMQQDEKEGEQ